MMTADAALAQAVRLSLHAGQSSIYRALRRESGNWLGRFRVVVAGRRWGKTHHARVELVSRALALGAGRYWYVAPTLKAAKDIFWSDLKAVLDPSWLEARPNESELYAKLRNGAEIRLHGADNPDDLRGRPLRFLVLDEYADMKPQAWSEALRPSLADYKAPALFIGTPKSFNHFYDLFQRGQSDDPQWHQWAAWQYKSIDNPTLDPAEIEEARRTTDPRTFRQEWEASFEAIAGRAYYAFSRLVHRRPVVPVASAPLRLSFDFNLQPATCAIWQRVGDEARVWREVWVAHAGGEATRACAMRAKAILAEAGWQGGVIIHGDASGTSAKTTGPSDHAVIRELFPYAVWRIPKANPHVRDRVAAVNARCQTEDGQTHFAVDPSCEHVIADLEQVTFLDNGELDKRSNPMLTHISDALGYGIHDEWPPVQRGGVGEAFIPWL